MGEYLVELDPPITSTLETGPILGSKILSEIGDIHRFDKPAKRVAYAGMDVSIFQSGQYEASKSSMSRRGSSQLRRAFFQAAVSGYRSDPVLKAFYEKKESTRKTLLRLY